MVLGESRENFLYKTKIYIKTTSLVISVAEIYCCIDKIKAEHSQLSSKNKKLKYGQLTFSRARLSGLSPIQIICAGQILNISQMFFRTKVRESLMK